MTTEVIALIGLIITIGGVGVRQELLRRRADNGGGSDSGKIDDLHRWHNQEDPNHPGAKLWWGTGLIEVHRDVLKICQELNDAKSEQEQPPTSSLDSRSGRRFPWIGC